MSNRSPHSFDSARAARRRWPRAVVRALRAALPPRCELCVAPTAGALLCRNCAEALPRLAAPCPRCALPSPAGAPCGACLAAPPPWDAALAAFAYAFPVDRLLQALKYGGRLALADWAGEALAAVVAPALAARAPAERPDGVVALPLAPARQRERGFNQAREIAAHVAAALDLPQVDALVRTGSGPAQVSLPWAARATNVRGAFAALADVRGARLAIVDDVMTTGATLAEAARTLARAGAARVECWVVARTQKPGEGAG